MAIVKAADQAIRRSRWARVMNLVALAFFITALLALGGFHFLSWWKHVSFPGWGIWNEMMGRVQSRDFSEPLANICLLMFPCFTALALSTPFLIGVLRRSRLAWWLLVLFSGGCLISVGAFAITISSPAPDEPDQRGPAFYCLMASLGLNFLGMLFVRRDVQAMTAMEPDVQ